MKGCARSHKKSFFCGKKSQRGGNCGCGALSLGGSSQRGGGCGCGIPPLTGGSYMGAPMMGGMKMGGSDPAVIGPAWTGAVSTWPGVAGVAGQTNNFALNSYPQASKVIHK